MALSETVQESMREAEIHLRNALSFASRTERPNTVSHIARLIADIDNIICADEMIDKLENRHNDDEWRRIEDPSYDED